MPSTCGSAKTARISSLDAMSHQSEDSQGTLLLIAIAHADVHPPLLSGFAVGRSDLVIDRGAAGSAEGVPVTLGALVMALSLGDLLLSQYGRCSRSKQQDSSKKNFYRINQNRK